MEYGDSERKAKLSERITVAESLLKQSLTLVDNNILGAVKLSNRIKSELRFLLKIHSGKIELKDDHLNSTNLTSLEALMRVIEKTKEKCGVLQNFHINTDQHEDFYCERKPITVDIVSKGGSVWIKVIARNVKALLTTWEGRGEYGEKSITTQAERFLLAAEMNPCDYRPPSVCFHFWRGVPDVVAQEMESMGIQVHGERLNIDGSPIAEQESTERNDAKEESEKEQERIINCVNFDVTALLCLVSNLCHGRNEFIFEVPVLTQQAKEERQSMVLPALQEYISNKTLYVCQTAVDSFKDIVSTVGGPKEKHRADELLSRVKIVQDQPSERTRRLKNSGKINERSKIIFGTGDSLKAVTVTANTGFVRAAMQSGVRFSVFEHEARALTEMKEKNAATIE